MKEKISCDNCPWLCCKNIRISLSEEELLHLFKNGTKLHELKWWRVWKDIQSLGETALLKGEWAFANEDVFYIKWACWLLDDNWNCGEYEKRPYACRSFKMWWSECSTKVYKHNR